MPGLVAALAPLVDTEAGPGLSPWLAHDSSSHTWAWARPLVTSVQWAARGHGWQGGG